MLSRKTLDQKDKKTGRHYNLWCILILLISRYTIQQFFFLKESTPNSRSLVKFLCTDKSACTSSGHLISRAKISDKQAADITESEEHRAKRKKDSSVQPAFPSYPTKKTGSCANIASPCLIYCKGHFSPNGLQIWREIL